MGRLGCGLLAFGLLAGGCANGRGGRGGAADPSASSALRVVVPQEDRDAEVWIDGNYVGQIGEFEDPRVGMPRLAPGIHRLEVRKPGRFPVQRTLEIPKDSPPETIVEAELLADPR